MINDLLDLAKIEAGTVEFHPTPLPLMRFLQALVETLQPVAREKTIDLQVQEKGSEVIVHADADKLTQVLPISYITRANLHRAAEPCESN